MYVLTQPASVEYMTRTIRFDVGQWFGMLIQLCTRISVLDIVKHEIERIT